MGKNSDKGWIFLQYAVNETTTKQLTKLQATCTQLEKATMCINKANNM